MTREAKIPKGLRTQRPLDKRTKTTYSEAVTDDLKKFIFKEQSKVEHWQEVEQQYGALVYSGVFANQFIELFELGFVRFSKITEQSLGREVREFLPVPKSVTLGTFERFVRSSFSNNQSSIEQQGRGLSKWASRAIDTAGYYLGQSSANWLEITTDKRTFRIEAPMLLNVYKETVSAVEAFQKSLVDSALSQIPTDGSPTTVSSELEKLVALKREGLLSDSEFAAAKSKLLSE